MSDINEGGPAFPEVFTDMIAKGGAFHSDTYSAGGMTLRDYFAAKALPICFEHILRRIDRVKDEEYLEAATKANKIANAMIKARSPSERTKE